ncbi:PAS domain S-box protein [Glaciimonas sp. CA11.2]|uniref:two-component system sensor histidine kinase NtrB n=1 Tax=unclassified Glaciimonas TaxID=2644401 RepID=UPI002AB41C09|nr:MULTISPECIES: PAS domain S-box protein [unclassified Glaciimonas]MDY7545014.1 PAS domain S-box protein [Glaciimonas sp. CA11.2]MEB0013317.1 PAS domain S-box protein [Glaciimonas sp. Cout2]MEB0082442.1 PAS domain S-box protein [Glaciimonas sp. Gout2]MEB0163660.1 PAS domain S-box protein [Glaciimonas sp. CA11.2]
MPQTTFKRLPNITTAGLQRTWRWLIPIFLVLLFLAVLIWLPWQSRQMEANDRQDQLIADTLWVEQAITFQLNRDDESVRLIASEIIKHHLTVAQFADRLKPLLKNSRELRGIAWLNAEDHIIAGTDALQITNPDYITHATKSAKLVRDAKIPQYTPPYKLIDTANAMYIDYSVPLFINNQYLGSLVSTYSVSGILNELVPWWFAQDNEISLTDADEVTIAKRAAGGRGHDVYTHRRPIDLPGLSLILRTNSVKSAPQFLPNLLVGSVIALSLGLVWSLLALWRDIHRRLAAENALRQEVAFRSAMENSLVTGLRARDLKGRVTYVNPAFCAMVGLDADRLVGKVPPMPYWAPEALEEFQERFTKVLEGEGTPQYEAIFLRANGERFPVLIFESALVDAQGQQTGWMGSILDISEPRRAEELNRKQQEKLESSARLASMGEIASTLAHELNQPLAAISSYTTGAMNMLESGSINAPQLKLALGKVNTQAQRAGQIIRSVHEFVKNRDPIREPLAIRTLVDNIMPLVELQAQTSQVNVRVEIAPSLPWVSADRMMLEQVLLNLTRNAIESMSENSATRRILRIKAVALDLDTETPQIVISVIDQGHGIPADVAARLFSPFYSTKAHGMGMGLNICRTAIEFHGGTLNYSDNDGGGTIFQFSLPANFPHSQR